MQVDGGMAGFVSISPSIPPLSSIAVIPVYEVRQEYPDHPPSWTTWPGISHYVQVTTVPVHITITSLNAGGAF